MSKDDAEAPASAEKYMRTPERRQEIYGRLCLWVTSDGSHIHNPFLVPLLIKISPKFGKVCAYLSRLMKIPGNWAKFGEAGIDLEVLRLLEKYKDDSTFSGQDFECLLAVFAAIIRDGCSPEMIRAFFKLLLPNPYLVKFEGKLVECLTGLLRDGYENRGCFVPLSGSMVSEPIRFPEEFSVVFWVFWSEPEEQEVLLFAAAARSFLFGVRFNENSRVLRISYSNREDSIQSESNMIKDHWMLFVVHFRGDSMAVSENGGGQKSFPLCVPFVDEVQPVIPGSRSQTRNRLGYFAVTDLLTSEDIQAIHSAGPAVVPRQPTYFAPFRKQQNEGLGNGFCDKLLGRSRADIMLPLFALCDVPFASGERFERLPSLAAEVLEYSLVFNP
jgi:hypothetical protein